MMKDEDFNAVTFAMFLSAMFGAVVGFWAGLLLLESFQKACGLGALLGAVFPVLTFFSLAWTQPWK